jgi:transcription initiation factor TFIIB
MHDYGLSSRIGSNVDGYGNLLSPKKQRLFHRLRKWDSRAEASSHDNDGLRYCTGEIRRVGSCLGLGNPIQRAAMDLIRKSIEEDIILGRSYEAFIGAAIYLAGREQGAVRPIPRIVEVSRADKTEIERSVFAIQKKLGLGIEPPKPAEYLPWCINRVRDHIEDDRRENIRWGKLRTTGQFVLEKIQSSNRAQGCSPVVLVGMVLYYLSRELSGSERLVQSQIAEALDISAVAIRDKETIFEEVRDQHGLGPGQQPA